MARLLVNWFALPRFSLYYIYFFFFFVFFIFLGSKQRSRSLQGSGEVEVHLCLFGARFGFCKQLR